MKLNTYKFSEAISVAVLGDVHAGNINFNKDLFTRIAKMIGETGSYYVLMGDIADAITPKDRRYDLESVDRSLFTVREQYDYVYDVLSNYTDGGTCLGVLSGNHDEKVRKTSQSGHNYTNELAIKLDAPYLGYMNYLHFGFEVDGRRSKKTLFFWHGEGKGRKPGSKLNRLNDLVVGFHADIYCMGHTHMLNHFPTSQLRVLSNGRHSSVKYYPIDLIHTGGFYKGYTTKAPVDYVARAGLNPLRLGCPFLHFDPKNSRLRVHLETE
jgi:predicted phosphodiesterase